ncbi:MAG: histidine phosphatase family protein [Phycisphaerae bacterium]|nr:histidine phosphatase family protein [Phycisphaerae bacterium]
MQLYVVQTGETIWELQQRMDSLAGVSLSEAGRASIEQVAEDLAPHKPTVIYASQGQAEKETADLLAAGLGLKVRTESRLDELDFGLWQGLTISDIRHRQPKLYKQWLEAPADLRPPGGESLQEAYKRLSQAVDEILKKGKKKDKIDAPILVLRPTILGVLRCRLERAELDDVWKFVGREFTWKSYEVNEKEF